MSTPPTGSGDVLAERTADQRHGGGDRARPGPPPRGAAVLTSPLLIGLLAGAQAVVGSLLCLVAPVIATWLVASGTGATWDDALRVAADGWLLAHGADVALASGHLGVVPLGLTLVPLAWLVSAGRRTAVALEASHPAADPASRTRRGLDPAAATALAGVVAAYAVLAVVVALVSSAPVARPGIGSVLVGATLLSGLGGGLPLGRARARLAVERPAGRPRGPGAVVADLLRLPGAARAALRAGLVALGGCLVLGALVLAVAVVVGAPAVLGLHRALSPGVLGGAALVLGQLLVVPTAVVWALSWVAGPGFAVGVGTVVTPGTTQLGALPALPLLGALPSPGTGGGWLWAVLAVPVAVGVLAGVRLRVSTGPLPALLRHRAVPALLRALAAGLCAGLLGGLLGLLASGPAGPGALAVVGPPPLALGTALGGEVGAGVLLALLLPGAWVRPLPTRPRRTEGHRA